MATRAIMGIGGTTTTTKISTARTAHRFHHRFKGKCRGPLPSACADIALAVEEQFKLNPFVEGRRRPVVPSLPVASTAPGLPDTIFAADNVLVKLIIIMIFIIISYISLGLKTK